MLSTELALRLSFRLTKDITKTCRKAECPFLNRQIPVNYNGRIEMIPDLSRGPFCLLLFETLCHGASPYSVLDDQEVLLYTQEDLGVDLSQVKGDCALGYKY
jgi:hypothetical protein